MAYRDPIFYFDHALRKAGAAALGGSAFNTSFPRERAHDSAIAKLARFNATTANQYVSVDRGAGYANEVDPNFLIIPAGHNLAGATVQVYEKATPPASGIDGTLRYSGTAAAATFAVGPLGTAVSERYFTINIAESGTAWEFPELWFSQERKTSAAVAVDAAWLDAYDPNVLETRLRGGARYRTTRGPAARRLRLKYHALSGADLTLFKDMRTATADGTFPLFVSPPESTELPVLMLIEGGFEFVQDADAPNAAAGATFELELTFVEALA